jgi:hypothetical protein
VGWQEKPNGVAGHPVPPSPLFLFAFQLFSDRAQDPAIARRANRIGRASPYPGKIWADRRFCH